MAAVGFEDDGRFDGINDRNQLAAAEWSLRVRLNEAHMQAGVTMRDPSTVYLDWSVDLAPDVTLEPNVILRGPDERRDRQRHRPGQRADRRHGRGAGDRCGPASSSRRSSRTTRPSARSATCGAGTVVGRGAQVGNYAELKNTHLGAGSKQHHASYLGDAEIGEGVNVGAGTITANYDGTSKQPTTVGDGAFLGVDTMLIAPVEVGEGARTGAGAVVTRDVPPGKLAVGIPARIREPRAKPKAGDPAAARRPRGDRTPDAEAGGRA